MGLLLIVSVAAAHPSDFRTLTIDLIIGSRGLEIIDGAVVEAHGPSYEPFPSVEKRETVAESVLQALGLANADIVINAELSDRYHEVGFTIDFSQPFHQGELPLRFDTRQFQAITSDLTLDHLKLSVCAADSSQSQIVIDASQPGRPPDPSSQERSNCEIWVLSPRDPPVSFAVTLPTLPATGIHFGLVAVGGLILLVIGTLALKTPE